MKIIIRILVVLLFVSCGGETSSSEEILEVNPNEIIAPKALVPDFDASNFIDNTDQYKDEIFEWQLTVDHPIFHEKSLRDYLGNEIKFRAHQWSDPVFPSNTNMTIFVPENLEVPKVSYSDIVIIKFKCGGDLHKGNIAISVTRP
jgi:hypothetical protein